MEKFEEKEEKEDWPERLCERAFVVWSESQRDRWCIFCVASFVGFDGLFDRFHH